MLPPSVLSGANPVPGASPIHFTSNPTTSSTGGPLGASISLAALFPLNPDAIAVNLAVVRLSFSPTLIGLFTPDATPVATHWVEQPNLKGEILCNKPIAGRCLSCDLGMKVTTKALLPVYDVASNSVGVLNIPEGKSAHSLGPLLMAEIQKGGLDQRFLAVSRNAAKFMVSSLPAQPGQDMGETAIKAYLEQVKAGTVDLTKVVATYSNESLLGVPELERLAIARGLNRGQYTTAPA
jgi:hypothetical protein